MIKHFVARTVCLATQLSLLLLIFVGKKRLCKKKKVFHDKTSWCLFALQPNSIQGKFLFFKTTSRKPLCNTKKNGNKQLTQYYYKSARQAAIFHVSCPVIGYISSAYVECDGSSEIMKARANHFATGHELFSYRDVLRLSQLRKNRLLSLISLTRPNYCMLISGRSFKLKKITWSVVNGRLVRKKKANTTLLLYTFGIPNRSILI